MTSPGTTTDRLYNSGGNLYWNGIQLDAGGVTLDSISDADGDTKIMVEKTTDEDIIRFNISGTERLRMNNHMIEPINSGGLLSLLVQSYDYSFLTFLSPKC